MLHEVDHVLKLVRERHGHGVLDLAGRVRAAQRATRIRDDRIEDFTIVELDGEPRIQVAGEKESRDVSAADAARIADQPVDRVRHQDHNHGICVDVRDAPEGCRVQRIEQGVEDLLQRVVIGGVEAARRRERVDIDGDVRPNRPNGRADIRERGAAHVRTHLERACAAERGRTGWSGTRRNRDYRRRRQRDRRIAAGAPDAAQIHVECDRGVAVGAPSAGRLGLARGEARRRTGRAG